MFGPVKNRTDLPEPTALLAEYQAARKVADGTHGMQPHHFFPENWYPRLEAYLKANDPPPKRKRRRTTYKDDISDIIGSSYDPWSVKND